MNKFIIILIISCLCGCIIAKNSKINVSLETVFEFDQKDKLNDLQILDDIQNFIDYVRSELLSSPKNKKTKEERNHEEVNQDEALDIRKHGLINLKTTRNTKTKSSPMKISDLNKATSNKIKDRAKKISSYYDNNTPFKPMMNLISTIIRTLKDHDIISVIDLAHNKTQKYKDNKIRRAMREGLDVLKETPVHSIREFLKKITNNDRIKFTNEQHRKLNQAFEKFFTELDKLLSQMDPESASLLTLLFHDLEKVFVKKLEKSRLKVLTENREMFHKLQSNPYIVGKGDNILDTVSEALKSFVYDNYGNLNKNEKTWVKSKIKPLWENVRKFFDNGVKKNMKNSRTARKNNNGFMNKTKGKYVESSVSIEDSSIVTVSLRFENGDKVDTFNIYTKEDNLLSTVSDDDSKTYRREKMCPESKDKCDVNDAKGVSKNLDTTPANYNRGKTHRVLNISRLAASFMDYLPFNMTFDKDSFSTTQASVEYVDEIDRANRKYEENRNPGLQQRFRVLAGNSITVTRTTVKPRKLKFWDQSGSKKSRKQQVKYPNIKLKKTKHSGLNSGRQVLSNLYEGDKPSRTTFKGTTPFKISECINQLCNLRSLRRQRLNQTKNRLKSDLETFEYNSKESDKSDLSIETVNVYPSLIKRIDNIEEKIQKIEKIIQTKKTTNVLDLKFKDKHSNSLVEIDKSKNKAVSTTSIYEKFYKNIDYNEVLERSTARSRYGTSKDITTSSVRAKTLDSTTKIAKESSTIKTVKSKMVEILKETTSTKVFRSKTVNEISEDNDWIINT